MGKDISTFPVIASFGCHMGTILSHCALSERSVGSALVAPLLWTSPYVAKNPCVITNSNFCHWHGCCFTSV